MRMAWKRCAMLLGLALAGSADAQRLEPVTADVLLLRGVFREGDQPDGNSVMLAGRRGWIVVDTGRHAEHTQVLIDQARFTGMPVTDIINTHWHLDHVSGNAAMRVAFPDAQVHASGAIDSALHGFLADYRRQLTEVIASQPESPQSANWRAEIARIDLGSMLRPTAPVTADGRRELVGRALDIHLTTHAATEGDVWVFDRASRTLIAGDLVTFPVPFLDTACPAGWREALDDLAGERFTRLIPGHGPVLDRRGFVRYRAAFDDLVDCAARPVDGAECGRDWIEAMGPLIPEAEHAMVGRMLDYYVAERLRGPGATRDCAR